MYSNSKDNLNQNFENNGNDLIDLKKIFNRITRQKNLIISLTSIATSFSIFYSLTRTPVWKGEFQIVVEQNRNNNNSTKINALNSISGLPKIAMTGVSETKSQEAILSSPSVLESVYNFVKKEKKNTSNNIDNLSFKEWRKTFLVVQFKKNTNILNISYVDTDKELILKTLKIISSKYQNYSKKDRQTSLVNGIKYLKVQEEQLKKKSNESLKRLNEFIITNGLGAIDGFVKLDTTFNDKNISSQTQNIISNKDEISNSGAGQRYSSLFLMLEKLESEYIDLSTVLKSNSKTLSTLKTNIDNLKEFLKRPNEILLEFRVLKRTASRDESFLKDIEGRLLALELEKVRKESPWELISEPTLLDQRVSPQRKSIVLSTFIISLIASFLIAKFKEFKSDSIHDNDFLKDYLKFKYLGKIYENSQTLNELILKKLIEVSNTQACNIIYLNKDSFFNNEIKSTYNLFPKNFKLNIVNSNSLGNLNSSSKIILISDPSNLSKKSISEISKFLDVYENLIIGWLNIEKQYKS
ncbi:hypothetical protein HA149_07170 [Prochlorococcus marinus XMU1406]|uniref:GumC family protein n=1 Tax=Prochlorococcus marinus TaxID=1219 RepID=UPI001AD99909|nr:Wzz/FepE/Etk N-terminal domain-containing protein [Prochlorococcus marinus]MBO8206837.1 hypothetical protein [Prochlorococcus marinus XMU1406]MCR8542656.1 Wzz/FepE/Etk N-terminal domain-containing protein [Prochlorococcus marinus XMU1427]